VSDEKTTTEVVESNEVSTPSETVNTNVDPGRYSRFITGGILLVILLLIISGILALTSPATFSAVISGF
jgi:hypothetical protein